MKTLSWGELKQLMGRLSGKQLRVVGSTGDEEYPHEWAWFRQSFPDVGERYVIQDGAIWMLSTKGLARLWALRPAPRVRALASGTDAGVRWVLTSDRRLTIADAVSGACWTFLLVEGLPILTYQDRCDQTLPSRLVTKLYGIANQQAAEPAVSIELPAFSQATH